MRHNISRIEINGQYNIIYLLMNNNLLQKEACVNFAPQSAKYICLFIILLSTVSPTPTRNKNNNNIIEIALYRVRLVFP